jgi:hypothetical protein
VSVANTVRGVGELNDAVVFALGQPGSDRAIDGDVHLQRLAHGEDSRPTKTRRSADGKPSRRGRRGRLVLDVRIGAQVGDLVVHAGRRERTTHRTFCRECGQR